MFIFPQRGRQWPELINVHGKNSSIIKSDIDSPGCVEIVEFIDGQDVGCRAQIQVFGLGHLEYLVCCCRHHFLESTVHDVFLLGSLQQRLACLHEFTMLDLSGLLNDLNEIFLRFLFPLNRELFTFLSKRPHLTCYRFLSHQKQETVTPPPLQSTSGRKLTPFLSKISSPFLVVGPLAASMMSLHWNRSALLMLMACSKAAGIKISLHRQNLTTHCKWRLR